MINWQMCKVYFYERSPFFLSKMNNYAAYNLQDVEHILVSMLMKDTEQHFEFRYVM